LIGRIQGQNLCEMGHDLLRIIQDGGSCQPGFFVGRVDLQHGSEIAPGASALSGLSCLQSTLHERCNLFVHGRVRPVIIGQWCAFLQLSERSGKEYTIKSDSWQLMSEHRVIIDISMILEHICLILLIPVE
jgi:hypothetical protein